MKHYTEKVQSGLFWIRTEINACADSLEDGGSVDVASDLRAAIAWLECQQLKAIKRRKRATPAQEGAKE
jgi:hypothetical protein